MSNAFINKNITNFCGDWRTFVEGKTSLWLSDINTLSRLYDNFSGALGAFSGRDVYAPQVVYYSGILSRNFGFDNVYLSNYKNSLSIEYGYSDTIQAPLCSMIDYYPSYSFPVRTVTNVIYSCYCSSISNISFSKHLFTETPWGSVNVLGLPYGELLPQNTAAVHYLCGNRNYSDPTYLSLPECEVIGDYAFRHSSTFQNNEKLFSVYLPKLEHVGQSAFYNTTFQNSQLVSSSRAELRTQNGNAFLLSIVGYSNASFSGDYTQICGWVFNRNYSIQTVVLPNCKSFGSFAFNFCSKLNMVTAPNCKYIGNDAFCGCSSLNAFDFSNVIDVGRGAFDDCIRLKATGGSLNLPKCVRIDMGAFSGCGSLQHVSTSDCLEYIGSNAFRNCSNLSSIILKNNIKYIGDNAFASTSLSSFSFDILSNCEYIGNGVFYNCKFSSLNISNLKSLTNSMFAYCTDLSSVYLNCSGGEINISTFAYCSNITSLEVKGVSGGGGITPRGTSGFHSKATFVSLPDVTIYTIINNLNSSSYNWSSLKTLTIGKLYDWGNPYFYPFSSGYFPVLETLNIVKESSIYSVGNTVLKTLNAPECLSIRDCHSCVSLESISLPKCSFISYYAFGGAEISKTPSLPECTYIGQEAFGTSPFISSLPLINSFRYMSIKNGVYALLSHTALSYASFPNRKFMLACEPYMYSLSTFNTSYCTGVCDYAFTGNTDLENVSLPNCTAIGDYAFRGCYYISNVSIPNCSYIGGSAFMQCTSLSYLYASNCLSVNTYAFYKTGLVDMNLDNCSFIASYAFGLCALKLAFLPNCKNIYSYAFVQNSSMSVVFAPSCSYIGSCAFQSCINLSKIILGGDLSYICALYSSTVFSRTGITSSTGSIMVPSSLYDMYRASNGWSYFRSRIFSY